MIQQIIYIASAHAPTFDQKVTRALEQGYEPLFPATIAMCQLQPAPGWQERHSVFMRMPDAIFREAKAVEEEAEAQ